MIDRNHLTILAALAEQGTLAQAAQSLHLTQSALSHSMRKLEQSLGVRIWQKQGRQLKLTEAGEYLSQLGAHLLPRLTEADATLRAFGSGQKGKLRFGMECHPCYEWLLTQLGPFLQRWPLVDVDVVQRFRFKGLEALQRHEIDILITSDPIYQEDLANLPMFQYELQLVTARGHGLSRAPFIQPDQLRAETLITFPVARERLDIFTHFLMPAGIEPAQHKTFEAMEIMLLLVAAGRGVCTLPDWLAAQLKPAHAIDCLRLGPRGVHKQLFLVLRKTDRQLSYLADFVAHCTPPS